MKSIYPLPGGRLFNQYFNFYSYFLFYTCAAVSLSAPRLYFNINIYSARKLFTGLAIAAFIVCIPKVSIASAIIAIPLAANTHQLMAVR